MLNRKNSWTFGISLRLKVKEYLHINTIFLLPKRCCGRALWQLLLVWRIIPTRRWRSPIAGRRRSAISSTLAHHRLHPVDKVGANARYSFGQVVQSVGLTHQKVCSSSQQTSFSVQQARGNSTLGSDYTSLKIEIRN